MMRSHFLVKAESCRGTCLMIQRAKRCRDGELQRERERKEDLLLVVDAICRGSYSSLHYESIRVR